MRKICLVAPYFGKFPNWFGFFLKSCEFNPTVNWIIFTDCQIPNHPKNVKFIPFSIDKFNKLASEKLKMKTNIKDPYKICDFRPAFGIIFEKYLKVYDFWGHTDIDVIYGNIRNFISKEMLDHYDIITAKKEFLVGHFTLYKNTKKINNLFKKNKDYKKVFESEKHCAFDECGKIHKEIINKKPIKKELLEKNNMAWLIKDLTKKGHIKSYFKTMYEEYFKTACKGFFNPWKRFIFYFNKGKLINFRSKKEILYIHLMPLKKPLKLIVEKELKTKDDFFITNHQIFYKKELSSLKRWRKVTRQVFSYRTDPHIGKIGIFIKKISPRIYKKLKKNSKQSS